MGDTPLANANSLFTKRSGALDIYVSLARAPDNLNLPGTAHGSRRSSPLVCRQSRIHSVGLPARTSLLPEPPPSGNNNPPPIPRRHSATPAVAPPPIPLRPPAIPKRSKNEKPIPIQRPAIAQEDRAERRKASEPSPAAPALLSASWSNVEASGEKLIDLGPFGPQARTSRDYSLGFREKDARGRSEERALVPDFGGTGFEEECESSQKSSFEELQKASRDLEKRLYERIVKSARSKQKDAQAGRGEARQRQNKRPQTSKFGTEREAEGCREIDASEGKSGGKVKLSRGENPREEEPKLAGPRSSCREAEKRSKFEELQAASKNLERRLLERTEEEDQRRHQDLERRTVAKERPISRYEELQRASQELERRLHPDQKSIEQQGAGRGRYEPEMERARSILQHGFRKERNAGEKLEKLPKATQTNLPPPLSAISQSPGPKPISVRQDSNVSSDSFSQTSSPSYTSKTMEAPLLPHKHGKVPDRALVSEPENPSSRPITKSTSTPASLQTIVRIHGGNSGSLHHKIIRDMTSSHYVTTGRLRFRFVQVLVNAVALLAIAGGLAAYFKTYPETVIRLENKTIYTNMIAVTQRAPLVIEENNPAPGICLPVIVSFCQYHKIPYNFTVFPNYMGNFGQRDAQHELELYDAVVDVRCYELAALFLCSVFVPKCGSRGHVVRPCRSLCFQTKRRCGFFLKVFGLTFPDYLECELFPENSNPDECVGHHEVLEAARRAEKPEFTSAARPSPRLLRPLDRAFAQCLSATFCEFAEKRTPLRRFFHSHSPLVEGIPPFKGRPANSALVKNTSHEIVARRTAVCTSGFQCDGTRCIPVDWRCDGHLDCADHSDEIGCGECSSSGTAASSSSPFTSKIIKKPILAKNSLSKSALHCGERRCMSASHICDGVMDCPWGQDERYCLRLSQRNGDIGEGRLEVYHAEMGKFMPACISHWESGSAKAICSMLGYTVANSSTLLIKDSNITQFETRTSRKSLLREFQECITDREIYPTAEVTCSEYACGRRRSVYGNSRAKTRIVGGVESAPGDWPFLAALLGGPEQIFYCAGVLIADQWVLTASHCVGNFSHTEVFGWTIQLGITRRHSHTYLGQKLKVKRVVPHPNYNLGVAHDNDVALFQLEKRVQYHEHLRPVCLPSASTNLTPGTLCTVIGWGKKNDTDSSEYEPAVNEVQVPVLNREICNMWLAHKELNVTDGMICAGYPDGGKDACQGDSGGPLLCQDENEKEKWFVGGIVSWGIKCAHPKLPGVYAYVPKYVPWIRSEIEKYSDSGRG
ncbi:hypothetical protein KM043_007357 [Ampulex compressa]|nr:hypothetical protein KM043_007357 [Ampulex compressa]